MFTAAFGFLMHIYCIKSESVCRKPTHLVHHSECSDPHSSGYAFAACDV